MPGDHRRDRLTAAVYEYAGFPHARDANTRHLTRPGLSLGQRFCDGQPRGLQHRLRRGIGARLIDGPSGGGAAVPYFAAVDVHDHGLA